MAKVKKCKLSWKPSLSDQVIGYRLYWSKDVKVSYDSNFVELGNVNEAYLPDLVKKIPDHGKSIILGITAVDDNGNESDMTILSEPYQLSVPAPPTDFILTVSDKFKVIDPIHEELTASKASHEEDIQQNALDEPVKDEKEPAEPEQKGKRIKYYDDVGFREGAIDKQP